jgi:hypothetical protein
MTAEQLQRAGLPDLSMYPAVMSKQQVARLFGRSVRWIELQLAKGVFPIPRLARSTRVEFSKADVYRFFEQKTFTPPEAVSVGAHD